MLVLSAVALAAPASAQAPVRTILLLTGTDTIAVEQVTRGPGRLEGDLFFRGGNQRWHYVVRVNTLRPEVLQTAVDWLVARLTR